MKRAKIGTHVSSSKTLDLVFDRGRDAEAETIQFFVRSPRSWAWKERTDKEKENFLNKKKTFSIFPVVVHASYLFNLASGDKNLWKKSVDGVIEELLLCEELGIEYYVIHAGKAKGQKTEVAISNILNGLNEIFSKVDLKNTYFLVETLAGQQGEIGKTTEEIKTLLEPFEKKTKIGVCVDTCHIFAAGYPIHQEEGFLSYKKELQDLIGLDKVKVIHANDSKTPFNSHKDRHEHIGEGYIGLKAFEFFLNDDFFGSLPYILETPKVGNWDKINMERLKSLIH
ncbi:MAG: endonuclease IV [Persephonella sp.]|nr:MAG: endonuclease IV [Persephonella sp.]